jgi:crotonobetainyl-CoA:carnitine CoA-transferase CaiB-like acyl-CoA transferase
VANRAELIELIEKAFAAETIGHWLAALAAAGIPAGRIRTLDQVYEWDQTRSQGLLIEVDHPPLGRVQLPGPQLRSDGSAGMWHRPPPTLGQHTDEVLRWLESG